MTEKMEQKDMYFNHTTPHISTPNPKPVFRGYYILIAFLVLTLLGCVVAVIVHSRRRTRLEELRHRLIPLYDYDPAEDQDWEDAGSEDERVVLAEPLYEKTKLLISSDYGT